MNIRDTFASLGLIIAMALPGLVSADEFDERLKQMRAYLDTCTQEHGYNPKKLRSYGDHEIAPGELKWRQCAYDGIRTIMVPASAVPDSYNTLIALDTVMTREIQKGTKTRAERKKRMDRFVDTTLAQEKAKSKNLIANSETTKQEELNKMRIGLAARQAEIRRMRHLQQNIR